MTTTKEDVQAHREYVEQLRQVLAAETTAAEQAAVERVNDIHIDRLKREEAALLAQIEQARGVNQAAGIEPTPEYEATAAGQPLPEPVVAEDPTTEVDATQTTTGPNTGEATDTVVVGSTDEGVTADAPVVVNPDLPPPPADVVGNVNDGVTPPTDPEVDDPADLPVRK